MGATVIVIMGAAVLAVAVLCFSSTSFSVAMSLAKTSSPMLGLGAVGRGGGADLAAPRGAGDAGAPRGNCGGDVGGAAAGAGDGRKCPAVKTSFSLASFALRSSSGAGVVSLSASC